MGFLKDIWDAITFNPTSKLIEGAAETYQSSQETPDQTQARQEQARAVEDRAAQTLTAPLERSVDALGESSLNPWNWVGLGPRQTATERLVGLGRLVAVGALVTVPIAGVGYLGYRLALSTQQTALALAPLAIQNAGGIGQAVRALR